MAIRAATRAPQPRPWLAARAHSIARRAFGPWLGPALLSVSAAFGASLSSACSDRESAPHDAGEVRQPEAGEPADAGEGDGGLPDAAPAPDDAGAEAGFPFRDAEIPRDADGAVIPDGAVPPDGAAFPDGSVTPDSAVPRDDAGGAGSQPLPQGVIDVAELDGQPGFRRFFGTPDGDGSLGVPIAASWDLDGDDHIDYALASFQASPLQRQGAGQIYVVFGDGSVSGDVDLAEARSDVLLVYGDSNFEGAGSEVWIDDVTGDGIGDLLVCRQNHRPSDPDRIGAGALSIIVGGPHLRAQLDSGEPIDLRNPPADVPVVTFIGAQALGRLGIWVRGGDITGDGIADLVVGADQEGVELEVNHGAAYVIRGGQHLSDSLVVDLLDFGTTPLEGHIARLTPPAGEGSRRYHFGATVNIADLDRNGRAEVLSAAAISRSGAGYRAEDSPSSGAEAQGGAPGGLVYLVWDDNFEGDAWEAGYTIDVSVAPGHVTQLLPATLDDRTNRQLGEELIGGADYDGDGRPDLFVGDMTAVSAPGRANGGLGFVIFDAAQLRELDSFTPLQPEADIHVTTFLGPSAGAIAADTVHHGDFDGDGVADLALAAPNANPENRIQAGILYVVWGHTTRWPAEIDLAALPSAGLVQVTQVWGAAGANGTDGGDMLAYSADVADIDGDGLVDLIANEMGGNGVSAAAEDAGNLLVISGALLASQRPDCSGVLGGGASLDGCGRCAGGQTGVEADQDCVQFRRDVQPLLLGNCGQCHGNSANLSVFSYDLLMLGTSEHGPVILPGDSSTSAFVLKMQGDAGFGDRMPPDYRLQAHEIDLIARWIDEGARDN